MTNSACIGGNSSSASGVGGNRTCACTCFACPFKDMHGGLHNVEPMSKLQPNSLGKVSSMVLWTGQLYVHYHVPGMTFPQDCTAPHSQAGSARPDRQ